MVTEEKNQQHPQDGAAHAAATSNARMHRHDRRTISFAILVALIVLRIDGPGSAKHHVADEEKVRRATSVKTTSPQSLFLETTVVPPNWTLHKTTFAPEADIPRTLYKTKQKPLSSYNCTLPNGKQISLPPVPRFIIVGAQKGGTSALGLLLKEHPLLLKSESFEPHFFDLNEDLNKAHHGVNKTLNLTDSALCALRNQYAAYFDLTRVRSNPQLLSYEKTPSYMMHHKVPERIKTVAPWAKVIVTLRNPVERCFSHFKMKHVRNEVPNNETFAEHFAKDLQEIRDYKCLPPPLTRRRRQRRRPDNGSRSNSHGSNISENHSNNVTESLLCVHGRWEIFNSVYRGFYAQQLERFYHQGYRLGHNLFVFQYERFRSNPSMVFDKIMDFLNIPRHEYQAHQLNRTIRPVQSRNDTTAALLTISQETRKIVHEFYKPYNDQLADLLGEEWRGIWDY